MSKLYHTEVFMPKSVEHDSVVKLSYSNHARREAASDRYGQVQLPVYLDTREAKLIEAEVSDNNQVTKRVYRTKLDESRDLVVVVQPDGFVRTVWINLATDVHKTLDRSKYRTS